MGSSLRTGACRLDLHYPPSPPFPTEYRTSMSGYLKKLYQTNPGNKRSLKKRLITRKKKGEGGGQTSSPQAPVALRL